MDDIALVIPQTASLSLLYKSALRIGLKIRIYQVRILTYQSFRTKNSNGFISAA